MSTYISQTLGVQYYLCPQPIWSIRRITGHLPCQVLAVVKGYLSAREKPLLFKIMSSIDVADWTLLEITKTCNLDFFKEEIKKWSQFVICFGRDFANLDVRDRPFIQTYSLQELIGSTPEIVSRKKELWLKLKKCKP